jgi:phenylpropionate dioxygenase-like ring-hydroxylating dioxygenase large terminal subunit
MRSVDELIANQQPGYSLDQQFYTDPAIYGLELERIIYKHWIFAGHVSQFAEAGDFRVLNAASESAIIVRNQNGELNGFANVCRHRGSLVCLLENGNTDKFSCPYHGWMYDLDGKLFAARNMPDDFDMGSRPLKRVSVEVVHGLVFVCFTDSPLSLESCRRDLAEPMAMFDFENLKVAAQKTYDIPANWKLSIENYQECYHCATAHPEYARMHTLMLGRERRDRVQQHMQERMAACGVREISFEFTDAAAPAGEMGYAYSRTALFEKYKTGSKDGSPVAPLLGNFTGYDSGASDFNFGPFSFMLAYSDHVVAYVFTPIDHGNSRCEIYWMVRGDAVEGKDYDVEKLTWLWDVTTISDKEIIVNNSKGVHSKYYEPGPFSGMERQERSYIEWILRELRS